MYVDAMLRPLPVLRLGQAAADEICQGEQCIGLKVIQTLSSGVTRKQEGI